MTQTISREYVASLETQLAKVEDELAAVRAQNAELVAACKWILQDIAYRAPELIAPEIKMRYARRLLGAIGREKEE